MTNILLKPYTEKQRADFIVEKNHNNGLKIEETETALYALQPNELLQDDEIIINPNYEQEQLNLYKNIAVEQVIKSYDYAVNYGVFKLDDTHYANMAWETTWSKVINLYNKTPSLPVNFSTRLYIKTDNRYYNTNVTNTSQGLDNMLLLLQKQQFMAYQPLRDSYLNEIKIHFNNKNLDGIKTIIEITKNNGGFGDTINEQEEMINYA